MARARDLHNWSDLGKGSVSVVRSALWKPPYGAAAGFSALKVAVKQPRIVKDQVSSSQNDLMRELDVSEALPELPSIVRPFGTVLLKNDEQRRYTLCLMTELWEDGVLDQYLDGTYSVSLEFVGTVMRCLAEAVEGFSSVNLVHCDLSARNVVVSGVRVAGNTVTGLQRAGVIDMNLVRPSNTVLGDAQRKARVRDYNPDDAVLTPRTDVYSVGERRTI